MFVTHVDFDEWADTGVVRLGYLHREVEHPDWNQIEAVIRALDGRTHTEVALRVDNERPAETAHMMIGGGNEGHYVAYTTYDGEHYLDLLPLIPDASAADVPMVVGGEPDEYPARMVVDLATVLEAARAFAIHGELAPGLNWEAR